MDRFRIEADDPTSTENPGSVEFIDIRADGELTDHDHRELWLAQYRLKLFFAARDAHRLRRALDV